METPSPSSNTYSKIQSLQRLIKKEAAHKSISKYNLIIVIISDQCQGKIIQRNR